MFCINCGNKIDDDAKFCPQCGASTEDRSTSPAPSVTLRQLSEMSKIRILNIATTCGLILECILVLISWINIRFVDLSTYNGKAVSISMFSLIEMLKGETYGTSGAIIVAFLVLAIVTILPLFIALISNICSSKKQYEYNHVRRKDETGFGIFCFIVFLIVSACLHENCLTIGETSGWLNVSLSPTMYILLITDLALFVIRRIGEAYNEVNAAE